MSFKVHEYKFKVEREKGKFCYQFRCSYNNDTLAILDVYTHTWYLYLYISQKFWESEKSKRMVVEEIINDNKAITAKTMVLNHILNLIGQDAF